MTLDGKTQINPAPYLAASSAELYGRVLRVNYAQPTKIKGGDKGWASQAVWADADDWWVAVNSECTLAAGSFFAPPVCNMRACVGMQ